MTVGEKIKKAIERAGTDPIKVAANIDMSTANLYRIFKRDSVETKYLVKLSELLNVPLSYFYEEEATLEQFLDSNGSLGEIRYPFTKADLKFELDKAQLKIDHLEQRLRDKEDIIDLMKTKLK
jgi:transcriptional regulator with XRE-family HTH domain